MPWRACAIEGKHPASIIRCFSCKATLGAAHVLLLLPPPDVLLVITTGLNTKGLVRVIRKLYCMCAVLHCVVSSIALHCPAGMCCTA